MALALAKVNVNTVPFVAGDRLVVLTDFTCDATYVTGGYALTPANLNLNELDFLLAHVQAGPTATITGFAYDYVNSKLKAIAGAAEVANGTDLSTVVGRVFAIGKGFPLRGVY